MRRSFNWLVGKVISQGVTATRVRILRGPLTEQGRQRLRDLALRNKPWRYSTGPRTASGKAQAAANGRRHQPTPQSRRQLRAEISDVTGLIAAMADLRQSVAGE